MQNRGENFDNLINQCSSLVANSASEDDLVLLKRLVKLNEILARETSNIVAALNNSVAELQSRSAVEYGSAKIGDKIYKTVKIGKQTWLAENLNYKLHTEGNNTVELPHAVYYGNDEAAYGKYGLLYNWYGAMKAAEEIEGWHLPTLDEWNELAKNTGGFEKCADNLKDPKEWDDDALKNDFGFSVFPAGIWYAGHFYNLGSCANFWTATVHSSDYAYYRNFNTGALMCANADDKIKNAYSVRLVKDSI